MLPDPLHPAIVHFPVVLAILVPLAALASFLLVRRAEAIRPAWLAVVLLAGGLAGSSWLAVETGEGQEERVEEVISSEAALSDHEARADQFLAIALVVLALMVVGLAPGRTGKLGRTFATVASLTLVPAGIRVGHSGGELVYVHGAAQAYTAVRGNVPTTASREPGERDEASAGDR
ncbi:MAG: DUF2231 domain-containing protein [Gemmatimonadota bacterium]|nr:DUF2231 domain-containing protein [Gemmatimonadota bacterium]